MSYIIFAWLTSISYGFGGIVGKFSSNHQIKNPFLYNFAWAVLTVVFILPIALLNHVGFPQNWESMAWLGAANAVSGVLFILAFYANDLSILSPLANLRTPLVALTGVFLLGEILTVSEWVLIFIVFIAGIFVNIDERMNLRGLINKNFLLALAWILSSVWFNSAIKYASFENGFWEVSLWSSVIAVILYLPLIPLFIHDAKKTPITRYWGVTATTVLYTAGFLFSIKAFGDNLGISMAIISLPLSMIMTIALSRFYPKLLEKHTPKVYAIRLISAGIMFAAAIGLSR